MRMIAILTALFLCLGGMAMAEGRTVTGCSYHCSGDENGSNYSIDVQRRADGDIDVTIERRAAYWAPAVTRTLTADGATLDAIDAIVREHALDTITNIGREASEFIVLDGNMSSVGFHYDDGGDNYMSESYAYSVAETEAYREIERLLRGLDDDTSGERTAEPLTLEWRFDDATVRVRMDVSDFVLRSLWLIGNEEALTHRDDGAIAFSYEAGDEPLPEIAEGKAGSMVYDAERGEIALFTRDFEPGSGLRLLGMTDEDDLPLLEEAAKAETCRIWIVEED